MSSLKREGKWGNFDGLGRQGKAQDRPFPGEGPQDAWGGDAALSEVPATLPHS